MSDYVLRIPALGCNPKIGELYDARTEKFCEISIFNKKIPRKALQTQDSHFLNVRILHKDTLTEKFLKFGVGVEQQASILARLIPLEGSAEYLKDQKQSARTVRSSIVCNLRTKDECLNIFHKDLQDAFSISAIGTGLGTHVVIGISWGASTILSCTYEINEEKDAQKIEGKLSANLKIIKQFLNGSLSGNYSTETKDNDVQFDVHMYGDILPRNDKLPTTLESALSLMKKVPSLVSNCNGGKGKPVKFILLPISLLQSHLKFSIKPGRCLQFLDEACLHKVVHLFDRMSDARLKLNDFHKDALDYNCVNEEDLEIICSKKIEISNQETSLTSQLSTLLVAVRSGDKDMKELYNFVIKFENSPVAAKNILKFLKSWESLLQNISLVKKLVQSGAIYVDSKHQERIWELDSKAVVFFFSRKAQSENSERLTENLQVFLKQLKKKDNGCKFFAVDCGTHPALLPEDATSCIQIWQGGSVIQKDLQTYLTSTTELILPQSTGWITAQERKREHVHYAVKSSHSFTFPEPTWDFRRQPSLRQYNTGLNIIRTTDELFSLGHVQELDEGTSEFELVKEYVTNSHNIKQSCGQLKIHGIHQLKTGQVSGTVRRSNSILTNLASFAFKSIGNDKVGRTPIMNNNILLLWCKTNPDRIKKLTKQENGCVAFYDRLARAFPVVPEDMEKPLRQIILLCSVSLGKSMISKYGYQYWWKNDIPPGFNSVTGLGRITSDWSERKFHNGVKIPLGKTIANRQRDYDLQYTEYIIFQAKQIRVQYAVDLEVIHGLK